MAEANHLSDALEGLFVTPETLWFATYPAIVEGLTAGQAASAPGPRFNSVWAITNHLCLCQRYALALLRGDPADPAVFFAEGAWPPVKDPVDEQGWQQAKTNLLAANHALAECVAGLTETALGEEVASGQLKRYPYILGHLAHNSYHLCEMISTRHMLGLWLEKT